MKFFLVLAAAALATTQSKVCMFQFTSLCAADADCGDLNGFNLTCKTSGTNKQCGCLGNDKSCNTNSKSADIAYQFDECTATRRCVTGNGFTASDADQLNKKICQEPLYCVREQNFNNATVLKSFCHTCGSCKAQNVKNGLDSSEMRFDCEAVCGPTTTVAPLPTEPTEPVTTRASKATTVAPGPTDASGSSIPSPTTSFATSTFVAGGVTLMAVAAQLL